jgi:hypothetical protein
MPWAGDARIAINHRLNLGFESSWPLRWRHEKIQARLKVILQLCGGTAPGFSLAAYGLANFGLTAFWRWLGQMSQRLNPMRGERFKRNDVRLRTFVEAESLRNREPAHGRRRLCSCCRSGRRKVFQSERVR